MFERFLEEFPRIEDGARTDFDLPSADIHGLSDLYSMGAGKSFGNGIIDIHSKTTALWARRLVGEMFPEICEDVLPIAQDWMGRQFSVALGGDFARRGQLHLIEPGSGEVFEVDCEIPELFNDAMVEDPVTYMASDLRDEWIVGNSARVPENSCVGFKVPLFLGGSGSVDNLEVTDAEVYWSLLGQLRMGIKDLPSGGKVGEVEVG